MIAKAHSQAHLQFTQANPQFKNCKRACLSATAFLLTLETIFFGNSSALIERFNDYKKLIMNKAQHTTKYIKHLADSASYKVVTFNKQCSGLTGLLSEMPNVSYT